VPCRVVEEGFDANIPSGNIRQGRNFLNDAYLQSFHDSSPGAAGRRKWRGFDGSIKASVSSENITREQRFP
jgi:hypothetical protein